MKELCAAINPQLAKEKWLTILPTRALFPQTVNLKMESTIVEEKWYCLDSYQGRRIILLGAPLGDDESTKTKILGHV